MPTPKGSIFCDIIAGEAPASVIYEDADVLAFMGIRPIHPDECMVTPKAHVDHFTDLDDELAQRIIVIAQRIGRTVIPADRQECCAGGGKQPSSLWRRR